MKKLILLAAMYCLQPGAHASAPSGKPIGEINAPVRATDRAKEHFRLHYEAAQDVTWYNVGQDIMYCIFKEGEKENRVFYDRKGYWKYTLQNYPGYILPEVVKQQISDMYKCYQISSVTEIHTYANEPTYVVNIENDGFIKVLKIVGEDIEVQQAFEKR